MATTSQLRDPVRADLVDAGIRLLAEQGAEALVVRRVAAAADVSTMCVYSRFGGKAGLINGIYLAGFVRLEETMSALDRGSDPLNRAMALALAYRSFALANPALYSLMFERGTGFDPSADLRKRAMGPTLSLLAKSMTEAADDGLIEPESPTAGGVDRLGGLTRRGEPGAGKRRTLPSLRPAPRHSPRRGKAVSPGIGGGTARPGQTRWRRCARVSR